jgi:cation-translocating P-type ATPase
LFSLAFVSLIVDVIIPLKAPSSPDDKPSYTTMTVILIMVFVSSIIHFIQEQHSSTNAQKLVKIIETTSLVQRNGILSEIPISDIIVGDIIHLAAGDIIPADVRILQAKDLFVSQSSLTGESDAIEKYTFIDLKKQYDNITDYHNLAFMGSNIISGSAIAIVVVTGNDTYIGQIASKINEKPVKTNFDKGIKKISIMLTIVMAIIIPIVFLIVGFTTKSVQNP